MSEKDNPVPFPHLRVDIDRLAATSVTAACELDGPADPAGEDTHRHVTAALEASL